MSLTVLADDALAALRSIGDPQMEGVLRTPKRTPVAIKAVLAEIRGQGGLLAFARSEKNSALLLRAATGQPEISLDPAKLQEAQRLFAVFGTEISGALLLAALPQSYATEFGAGVLGANAELERDLARRILGTAQFLLVVMQRAKDEADEHRLWAPDAGSKPPALAPWKLCSALRIYHHAIRMQLEEKRTSDDAVDQLLGKHNEPPLNQEDLLGMLLSFSVTVFEVLERYGICWTADEQEAYLHAWDVVGSYLGIGSPGVVVQLEQRVGREVAGESWHGLRPPTIADTRALLDQIRARQWLDPAPTSVLDTTDWSSVRSGRVMTKALLDELAAAMPPSLKLLPIAVMRALAPDVVRRRLSLGANGLFLRALDHLPKRRHVIDRFTSVHTPNPLTGRVLRMMANDVTARASMRFLRDGDFVFPGLEDWSGSEGVGHR